MKLKDGLVITPINDKYVLVDTGVISPRFNGIIKLNDTSKFIVELIKKEDLSMEQIINKVLEKYEGDESIIRNSVIKTIEQLEKVNLIAE